MCLSSGLRNKVIIFIQGKSCLYLILTRITKKHNHQQMKEIIKLQLFLSVLFQRRRGQCVQAFYEQMIELFTSFYQAGVSQSLGVILEICMTNRLPLGSSWSTQ